MAVIAFPGDVRYAAEKAHCSDPVSEDFVDGLVLRFFLSSDTGVPLSSIRASR